MGSPCDWVHIFFFVFVLEWFATRLDLYFGLQYWRPFTSSSIRISSARSGLGHWSWSLVLVIGFGL